MSGQKPTEGPIFVHEQSLASKVGADSEAKQLVDEQELIVGLQLLMHLTVLLRVSRSHGVENRALDRPIEAILSGVKALGSTRPVELSSHAGFAFLWDRHLKAASAQMALVAGFLDALAKLGVGAIEIDSAVTEQDLRRFAAACAGGEAGEDPFTALELRVRKSGVTTISVSAPRPGDFADTVDQPSNARGADAPGSGGSARNPAARPSDRPGALSAPKQKSTRERARDAYARAASAVDSLDQQARGGGTLNFRQARRAIQGLVDALRSDEATVMGLTSLRAHDEYTHNHSVNVAVLAVALGHRAGYPKAELADLGLAALFHDVGKCAIPLSVLNKEDALDSDDWARLRTHPSEGVLSLLKLRGIDGTPARMVAASFEHHLTLDGTGYPAVGASWKPTLSSRIISLVDCYDAMTSARVYRREPSAPAEALAYIRDRAGRHFDPVLVKYFVASVGILPIGSLALLGDGRLAVITRAAPAEHALRPPVRPVANADGSAIIGGDTLDLSDPETYAETGGIVKLIDNAEWHLDTSRWLV